MTLSRRKKWGLILLAATAGLMGVCVACSYLLPAYLETRLLPRLGAAAGLDPLTLHIRRLGLFGADLGPIRIGINGHTQMDIAAVQIDYSPWTLLQSRIASIVLNGARIRTHYEISTTGPAAAAPPGSPTLPDLKTLLPIKIQHLSVYGGLFAGQWSGLEIHTPFELELDASDLMEGSISFTVHARPRDSNLRMSGTLDLHTATVALDADADGIRLTVLEDLLAAWQPLTTSGELDLTLAARGRIHPFGLEAVNVTGRLRQSRIAAAGIALENHMIEDPAHSMPIIIQAATVDKDHWHWSMAPFRIQGPVQADISLLQGDLVLGKEGWRTTMEACATLPRQAMPNGTTPPVILMQPLALAGQMTAHRLENRSIQFDILLETPTNPQAADPLILQSGDAVITGNPPRLTLAGVLEKGTTTVRFRGSLREPNLLLSSLTANARELTVVGEVRQLDRTHILATIHLPDLRLHQEALRIHLPDNHVDIRLQRKATNPWSLAGEYRLTDGHIELPELGLVVKDVSVRLPLQWPTPRDPSMGELRGGPILWQAEDVGDIQGRLGLVPQGARLEAVHRSKLFPGLNVLLRTDVNGAAMRMAVTVPEYAPTREIDLGRFAAAGSGLRVNGRFQAAAELLLKPDMDPRGKGNLKIEQGTLQQMDGGLALSGITLDITMADLPGLRSGPGQHLQVAAIRMGTVTAEDLTIGFQFEPGPTLLIERAGLNWAHGSLQTQAFRLKPGLDDLSITAYCDRLDLATVLEQLGVARASGEGSVNGRIPMHWQNGRLVFDNGFLYSTPGQSGTIQLFGADFFLEDLPPGSPQQVQLDIATEALKDYTYNWVRLHLNSEEGDLALRLQLDGKPNRLLPFAYDPKSGGFQRYAGEGQADFKGIRIDLNFRTPLDQILDYKTLWRS